MKKIVAKSGGSAGRFRAGIACFMLLIALFGGLAYPVPQETDQQNQDAKRTASSAATQQRYTQSQAATKSSGAGVEQRMAAMEEKLTRIENKVDQLSKDLHAMWKELWGMIDRLQKK